MQYKWCTCDATSFKSTYLAAFVWWAQAHVIICLMSATSPPAPPRMPYLICYSYILFEVWKWEHRMQEIWPTMIAIMLFKVVSILEFKIQSSIHIPLNKVAVLLRAISFLKSKSIIFIIIPFLWQSKTAKACKSMTAVLALWALDLY